MFSAFVARLQPDRLPPPPATARRAAVVITPWCSCPVPWFSLTVACLLRREGVRVSLVWNDICDMADPTTFERETQLIGAFLKHFRTFDVIRLSEQAPAPPGVEDRRFLATPANVNAIWQNRSSLPRQRVAALEESMTALLSRSLPHIKGLFARHRFDFALVPGGLYGNSGLYIDVGQSQGVRMSTFDSNPGQLLLGLEGTAGCCTDIPRCVREAGALLGDRQEAARAIARRRLQDRMGATEKFFTDPGFEGQPIQLLSAQDDRNSYSDDVVFPLNVDWDAAALGLHRFFRDDCEWLVDTIGYLLERTDARVAVRQHPGNRVVVDGAVNLEQELHRHFGQHPRFRFIRARDPVNTYKLMAAARVVLPFSSTAGIEAAMLGKPLVLPSRAYYAEMAFVEGCHDKESYLQRVAALVRQPPAPDPAKVAAAELAYFFSAVCNLVPTAFTPHPQDFAVWSGQTLDTLAGDDGVKTAVRALVQDLPAAALQCRQQVDLHALQVTTSVTPLPAAPSPPAVPHLATAGGDREVTRIGQPYPCYPGVTLGTDVQILAVRNVEIGEGSCVGDFSWLNVCVRDDKVRMRIGRSVLIGRFSMVSTGGYLEIGDYCLFGPRVTVVDADHGFSDINRPYVEQTPTLGRSVVMEENCWVAAGAVIAGHLTVGRGSVIGANAVVTQDVPPFSVVVGHPGRIVKMYDPTTGRWEPAKTEDEQRRILENRARSPLPDRDRYRAILRQNAREKRIDPIVAGRGECL